MSAETADALREEVRRRYAKAARAVSAGMGCSCGGGSCCEGEATSPDCGAHYSVEERRTAEQAGIKNAHFLKGLIEDVPLPAESVDVVISNCVINLSVDKPAVFAQLARVLSAGGRIGISDIVAEDRLSPEQRAARGSYVGCIAGALSRSEYEAGLEAVGLEDVSVTFTHEVAEGMHAAIVKARKPLQANAPEEALPRVETAPSPRSCC